MKPFNFSTSRSIINEPGAVNRLGEICRSQNIRRPFIVTDQGIVQTGLLEKLETALRQAQLPCIRYTDVVADPPEAIVTAALEQALAEDVDGVIGFGGGSSMDTAKLVALLARSGEKLEQVYGVEQASGQRLPLVLIPTTAGTARGLKVRGDRSRRCVLPLEALGVEIVVPQYPRGDRAIGPPRLADFGERFVIGSRVETLDFVRRDLEREVGGSGDRVCTA